MLCSNSPHFAEKFAVSLAAFGYIHQTKLVSFILGNFEKQGRIPVTMRLKEKIHMYKVASRPKVLSAFVLLWLALSGISSASAASNAQSTVPEPAPAAGGPANIFYGAINPSAAANAPVLLFVHGLGSNAEYWFTSNNTMYEYVYNAGYRSAYVSLNADNSKNNATLAQNATTLEGLLPQVLAHYTTQQVYLVCHSKGRHGLAACDAGLDDLPLCD